MAKQVGTEIVTTEEIQSSIIQLREQRVMLDEDLARLYGVTTKVLNQAVKRNSARFPADFIFQLTDDEWQNLRSQTVTARKHGGRRTPPFAFTQEGVAMLSGVLNSERAVQVNVEIMRAFVRYRGMLSQNGELGEKLRELEGRLGERLKKHDTQIAALFEAMKRLITNPPARKPTSSRQIGFHRDEEEPKDTKANNTASKKRKK